MARSAYPKRNARHFPWHNLTLLEEEKQRRSLFLAIASCLVFVALADHPALADKHKWNNPENERRYKDALMRETEARQQESQAWQNYDHQLGRAQDDVRSIRNRAMKGASGGAFAGPGGAAAGAAVGGATAAGEQIYGRTRDAYQEHKKKH